MQKIAVTFLIILGVISCRNDKTPYADLYVGFEYSGPKIDTGITGGDRLIFTNFDGSPVVEAPAVSDGCANPTLIGTFLKGDTIKWHLRLMQPDGGPALFQVFIKDDGQPVPVQNTLYFYNPADYYFHVSAVQCSGKAVVLIRP